MSGRRREFFVVDALDATEVEGRVDRFYRGVFDDRIDAFVDVLNVRGRSVLWFFFVVARDAFEAFVVRVVRRVDAFRIIVVEGCRDRLRDRRFLFGGFDDDSERAFVVETTFAKLVRLGVEELETPIVDGTLFFKATVDVVERRFGAAVVDAVGDDGDDDALRTFRLRQSCEVGAERVDRFAKRVVKRGRAATLVAFFEEFHVEIIKIDVARNAFDLFRE